MKDKTGILLAYTEIGLAFASLGGFVLRIKAGPQWGEPLLLLGLLGLSLLYILQFGLPPARRLSPVSGGFHFSTSLIYLVYAIGALGLAFKWMLWPEANYFLRYALMGMLALLLVMLFQYRLATEVEWIRHYRRVLARSLIWMATVFLFYLTPYQKITRLYFPEHPAYAEAFGKYLEKPQDSERKKAWQREKARLTPSP